jgi:hypothetical protein
MTLVEQVREYGFENTTGEEIPPFACLAVTSSTTENGFVRYVIRKPNYEDEQAQNPGRLVFNSGAVCPVDAWGSCSSDFPAIALVNEATEVTEGQIMGPVENQWYLGPYGNAFVLKAKEISRDAVATDIYPWLVEPYVAEVEIVRVTSATPTAGYYSGVVERFDKATLTWIAVRDCKVRDTNA